MTFPGASIVNIASDFPGWLPPVGVQDTTVDGFVR